MSPKSAFAAPNINTLDSKGELVSLDNAFGFDPKDLEISWSKDCKGLVKTDSVGNKGFYIPSKGSNGNWSYSDPVEFKFGGNYLGDREIEITIHIDKIQVTSSKATGSTIGKYFKIGYTYFINDDKNAPRMLWFTNVTGDYTEETTEFGSPRFQWFVNYTVTVTWADSGQVVDLPFYQTITDIDAGSSPTSYYRESWTPKDGFTNDFYVYDTCKLLIDGTTFRSTGGTSGNDSLTKAGVIALTTNGQFSGQMELGRCGNGIALFSNFSDLDKPNKSFQLER